jgi:ferredoxin
MGVGHIAGAAYIEPAVCHGCGSCASECPARAIQLLHYKDIQTMEKIDALFHQPDRIEVEPEYLPPKENEFQKQVD